MVWSGMTLEQYLKTQKPKLSHATFAERVGVSQVTINRYIRGDRFPAPAMIEKIHVATKGAVKVTDWYSKPISKANCAEVSA